MTYLVQWWVRTTRVRLSAPMIPTAPDCSNVALPDVALSVSCQTSKVRPANNNVFSMSWLVGNFVCTFTAIKFKGVNNVRWSYQWNFISLPFISYPCLYGQKTRDAKCKEKKPLRTIERLTFLSATEMVIFCQFNVRKNGSIIKNAHVWTYILAVP